MHRFKLLLPCNREAGRLEGPISFTLYDTVDSVNTDNWDRLTADRNVFLTRGFLRALESASVPMIHALFRRGSRTVGAASFQSARFRGGSLAEYFAAACPVLSLIARSFRVIRDPIASEVIVCGTPFSTGEHGFVFDDDIPMDRCASALCSAADAAGSRLLSVDKAKAPGVLFKEFSTALHPFTTAMCSRGYTAVSPDPTMVLHIDPSWRTFDDYLASLSSKYRVKARREHAKSKALEPRYLTALDVHRHKSAVDKLFDGVARRAQNRLGDFDARLLAALCRELGDKLILRGYFLDDRMVGFLFGFVNNDTLEAGFVGFDYDLNRQHAIYPRMLYDYLKEAIERGLAKVNLGRTAVEIKSTLGAVPVPMTCCLRLQTHPLNTLLPLLSKSIRQESVSVRQPFKQGFYQDRRSALPAQPTGGLSHGGCA